MIGLVQRVESASVMVDGVKISEIGIGILLLLGVEKGDVKAKAEKLANKVASLRIFEDDTGKMNHSLQSINAQLLVVSQFTLAATTGKGNRPGFSNACEPQVSKALYQYFMTYFESQYGACFGGRFGANMKVSLINDGPATFYIKT